ncbi:MAG TPA: zf-HC2 domain-containing protein [Longimicrobiales bacterium]|nr:zf-HC2 domain-containing protein [Longimicrobiales bacterium]
MMEHLDDGRLNDFVDGLLPAQDAKAVAEHLDRCDECAAEVAGLREILADARTLPLAIEPDRDLWHGIAARLERPPVLELGAARARRTGLGRTPGRWPTRFVLAAAAGLLVVASSTVTLLVVRGRGEGPVATVAAPPTPDGLHLVSQVEGGYAGAVDALESSLASRRQELQPETVAVIEENLAIIDRAIAEASAALSRDPANLELAHRLRYAYRHKVELLERAVKLQRI